MKLARDGMFEVIGYDRAGTPWLAIDSPFTNLEYAQKRAGELSDLWGRERCYVVHDLENPEAGDLRYWMEEEA